MTQEKYVRMYLFPSPTGVTYYKLNTIQDFKKTGASFRPQQGLPIINYLKQFIKNIQFGFRPQQGLPIINPYLQNPDKHYLK